MTALLVALTLLAPAKSLPPLSTAAEASGYKITGRYEEAVRLCHDFVRAHKNVTCETFGTSPERRPMVALSVGRKGAPTLLVQGGIHAGEIDGKDAGFWVLRELLDGKLDGVALDKIRVVFVPVFNVDGHERFGAHNRPNQIGPEEMGWRTTAQNLNLNRDYTKAEAPEMRAMLKLMQREDPIVYMDLHVTDGAEFQHDIAVLVSPADGTEPAALLPAAASLRASIKRQLEATRHLPIVDFYPSFVKHEDPSGGFAALTSTPRFSDAYAAARDRLGILVETHSWKDYATRVRATHDAVVAVLRELTAHGVEWQRAARAADAEPLAGKTIALAWKPDSTKPRTIDFLGYHYTRSTSPISTVTRIEYDTSKPEVWHVPFYGVIEPSVTVTLPRAGWFVPRAFAELVAAKLAAHGLVFKDVDATRTGALAVDAFRASDVKHRADTFEGRAVVQVRGAWSHETRSFAGGGLFVPVAQPHARLAAQLLEPEGPDSLTTWGFFDAVFEEKEYMEDYVLEAVAAKMMQDPAVKAEWDQKMKDPAFAKSPHERLDFFYKKHPSWDAQLGLVPVYRLQAAP